MKLGLPNWQADHGSPLAVMAAAKNTREHDSLAEKLV